jgi:hypothetical protein
MLLLLLLLSSSIIVIDCLLDVFLFFLGDHSFSIISSFELSFLAKKEIFLFFI